ncbi:MAG: helix-turn-helix transcriptional regulator [Raoultibacter sp.]
MNIGALINEQAERARVLHRLMSSIAQRPMLLVALTLYWTWVNMAFQSPLFFPAVTLPSGALFPSWVGPVAASAIMYFILGMWFKRINVVVRQRWYIGAITALMAVGALLCFVWINAYDATFASLIPFVLYGVGSAAIGCGTACLLIEWGRVFGYLGPQDVLFQGIVSMLCSALLICGLSFFPTVVSQLIFVMIPAPLAVCFYRVMRTLPRKTLFDHGLNADLYTPYKFLFTALLHGLALGVLLGSVIVRGSDSITILITALSFVIAAVLLFLTAVFVKMDFNHLIYQVGFSIMATGALLVACLQGIPVIGESIQLVGFCYVHLIMWGVCSYLTKNFTQPATWVVAWPTCSLMVGQFVGGIMSSSLVQQPDPSYWVRIMATVVSFVILMAALFMLSNRNLTTGWGIARPANGISPDAMVDQVSHMLTVENNLTPRESEILALAARGRNRKFISEELTVSEETIKSHVYSIYRKLGIHSQQELLDLVEARAAAVSDIPQEPAFK